MGKLIVIEGLDGCGKSTQLELLPEKLREKVLLLRVYRFPIMKATPVRL